MYYFKWRRGEVQLPFGNNPGFSPFSNNVQAAPGTYPQGGYNPNQNPNYQRDHYQNPNQGQPGYYNNTHTYPPL